MSYTCENCGEAFKGSTHGNAKNTFCSENCRKRYWERSAYRGQCKDCGAITSKRHVTQCDDCYNAARAEAHRERDERIVAWWAEGKSFRFICEQLGWKKGHLAVEMDRLRAKGYDLPYRRAPRKGRRYPDLPTQAKDLSR